MSSAKRAHMAGWLSGRGLEFGALHQPLAVPEHVEVEYVDRLSVADLRAQYPELAGVDLVPVHHIGSVERLDDVDDGGVDFVIACHVLEHVQDPTAALSEIHRVLRDGGVFFCALPEPRVTFDRWRSLTTMDHLMLDHPRGAASKEAHFVDWIEHVERHQDWWGEEQPDPAERLRLLLDMDYSIHYHVWQPDTFLDFLSALRRQGSLCFEMLDFAGCQPGLDDEFIFILRKGSGLAPAMPPEWRRRLVERSVFADPAPSPGGARHALGEAARANRAAAKAGLAALRRRIRRRYSS